MILNFYINYIFNLIYLIFNIILFIFIFKNTIYINFIDIYFRFQFNDFFWNLYYIFWTNLFYLYFFFWLLLLIIIIFNLDITFNYLSIYIIISFYFIFEYSINNIFIHDYIFNGTSFNLLLLNTINKYHPILFYISVILVLYSIRYYTNYINKFFNYNSLKKHFLIKTLVVHLLSFSLFLGSWWALQEGSWGGWWNWDPSEVYGLVFFIYLVYIQHQPIIKRYNYYQVYNHIIFFILQLILYFFIQLNFNLISHNFGINITQSFWLLMFFFFFFIYVVLLSYLVGIYYINFLLFFNFNKFLYLDFYQHYISITIIIISITSFNILLEEFIFNLLNLNFLNWIFLNINLFIYLFLYTYLLLFKFSNLFFFYYLKYSGYLNIYILFFINIKFIYLLHIFFLLFLYINIFYKNFNFLISDLLTIPNTSYILSLKDVVDFSLNLDTFFISVSYFYLVSTYLIDLLYNCLLVSFMDEVVSFLHIMSTDLTYQILWSGSKNTHNFIFIVDVIIYNIFILYILIFILLWILVTQWIIIIF